jgi:hypothetical protein
MQRKAYCHVLRFPEGKMSTKCIILTRSLCEYVVVVGDESYCSQISKMNSVIHWLEDAPQSMGNQIACICENQ